MDDIILLVTMESFAQYYFDLILQHDDYLNIILYEIIIYYIYLKVIIMIEH
jgi:hypothetical protein